jgi:hypothetical protein
MSSSRTSDVAAIAERSAPTPDEFRNEIVPAGRPFVLRSVAAGWPLVSAARQDPDQCMALLSAHASAEEADVLRAHPDEEGRFHYSGDGSSLNFDRGRGNVPGLLGALRDQQNAERPYAMVAQGLVAERYVPGFSKAHPMRLVPASAEPRLWIGNAAKVATHNDPVDNLAVVAVGRRRFTLFPPEAEPCLYMGPAHPTPAGTPVSMVHVSAPDLGRYPRFADALESAQEAELSPGDAIFIPKNWFHHVEALERFNVLVNYWWDAATGRGAFHD